MDMVQSVYCVLISVICLGRSRTLFLSLSTLGVHYAPTLPRSTYCPARRLSKTCFPFRIREVDNQIRNRQSNPQLPYILRVHV